MQEIEFHFAMHRPGAIVDAGAHEGRLTLPLARLPASRGVAFEPLPPAFARLQKAVSAEWDGMIPPHVTLLARHRQNITAQRRSLRHASAVYCRRGGRRSPKTTWP